MLRLGGIRRGGEAQGEAQDECETQLGEHVRPPYRSRADPKSHSFSTDIHAQ
jgi:hypothetical protein